MADTRSIQIGPFLGIDQRWGVEAPTAAQAHDLYYDPRGGWSSAGGYKRIIRGPSNDGVITNPFGPVGAIESIHFFSQHNGARRWYIYIDGSGNLVVFNPSTAARTGSAGDAAKDRDNNTITRSIVYTPWQRNQSVCVGDQFYLVNGIDRPVTFNGVYWDYAGWQGPAGPITIATMNGPHADDSGYDSGAAAELRILMPNTGIGPASDEPGVNYYVARRYKCSFVNDRGAESPLSEASDVFYNVNSGGVGVGDAPTFGKMSVPIGPNECVARRIYCTQNLYSADNVLITGRDTQYYYWGEIQDNVTDTVIDGKPDGYLGALVNEANFGAWPVQAKYVAFFKGRMYASGAGNSDVYFSRSGHPEVFPPGNVIDIGDSHLGPITAMYATRNVLVVAKTRGLYLIKDDGVNPPKAETLTTKSGWSAQNTVQEIPGIGIFGLSDDGITMLKGTLQNEGVETQTFNAAVELPDTFRKLNRAAIQNACAAVYHRDKEYWLCIPTVGNSNNNLVLIYHYEIRQWSTRENYPIASILETADAAGNLLFGSYASTTALSPDGIAHLGIMVYSRGCQYKDEYNATPTEIEPLYQTNAITAAGFRAFKPLQVLVECVLHGDNDLEMNVNTNHSAAAWFTASMSVDQQYPQAVDRMPIFGSSATPLVAVFDGTDTWQSWHEGYVRFDIEAPRQQPVFSAQITLQPASRYMTLMGMSLEINPEQPVNKPLRAGTGS